MPITRRLSNVNQIFTSAVEPDNIDNGVIWNELDQNGNLIKKWNRINNQWESDVITIKKSSEQININNQGFIFYVPFDENQKVITKPSYARFDSFLFSGNYFNFSIFRRIGSNNSSLVNISNSLIPENSWFFYRMFLNPIIHTFSQGGYLSFFISRGSNSQQNTAFLAQVEFNYSILK